MSSLSPRLDNLERNRIINGNFDFWQRGTSFTASATSTKAADRWKLVVDTTIGAGSYAMSRSTDVPTQTQSKFVSNYSLLVQTPSSAPTVTTSQNNLAQYVVEGNDYAEMHSKAMRLVFWVKSSSTGTFPVAFQNGALDRSYVATYTILAANTWEKKTIDLTFDTSGTWLFDTGAGLRINFVFDAGNSLRTGSPNQWLSGNFAAPSTGFTNLSSTVSSTLRLAQVMLIPQDFSNSSAAEPTFSRVGNTIQQELTACKRYYEAVTFSWSHYTDGNQAHISVAFEVEKRVIPTVVITSSGASLLGMTAITVGGSTTGMSRLLPSQTGGISMLRSLNASFTCDSEF